jgi:hypothetical protein
MEDRTINDWMVTSDPNDQQSIVDDLAGSTQNPVPSNWLDADFC